MAIPDYQTLMKPLLSAIAEGGERSFTELEPVLADNLHLTAEERAHRLPSGQQTTFRNRLHWASFYLSKALLLEKPRRGFLRITPRGIEALRGAGDKITAADLKQFPEFREFLNPGASLGGGAGKEHGGGEDIAGRLARRRRIDLDVHQGNRRRRPQPQDIGLEEVGDGIWNIVYYRTLLGKIDERSLLITGV